jgi:hypothetical protein
MPFKSEAQRRLFYAKPKLHKYIDEFEAATRPGTKLPEHVPQKISNRIKKAYRNARNKSGRP